MPVLIAGPDVATTLDGVVLEVDDDVLVGRTSARPTLRPVAATEHATSGQASVSDLPGSTHQTTRRKHGANRREPRHNRRPRIPHIVGR